MSAVKRLNLTFIALEVLLLTVGCDSAWHRESGPGLSRSHDLDDELGANAPPKNGPKLGILADLAPVFDRPQRGSRRLGWLRAGAQVPRAETPVKGSDCPSGWFAIYPRGYICSGAAATTDLSHPTLSAMGLAPRLNEPLPYPYAQARVATEVFEPNNDPEPAVHSVARLRPASVFAVVGSWQAMDETDQRLRLALMTGGMFVRADDLRAAHASIPQGLSVEEARLNLPLAFITSDDAKCWRLHGDTATPAKALGKGTVLHVGAHARLLGDQRYYPLDDGTWLQESDATVIPLRNDWPSFARSNRHWLDISLTQGALVLYAGQRAEYVARSLRYPKTGIDKLLGETDVIAKCVTDDPPDPKRIDTKRDAFDVPWVVQLQNGLVISGTLRKEPPATSGTTPRLELAPADAQQVWAWAEPKLPEGWHGVSASSDANRRTPVIVH